MDVISILVGLEARLLYFFRRMVNQLVLSLVSIDFSTLSTYPGPVPNGADAVVQVEDTESISVASAEPKRVRILKQTSPGVDIRAVVRT